MNISLANNLDKNNLYELWQKTFNDSLETIDLFFKYCYKNENTIVCREDDRIISMLYLIPADLIINKKHCTAFYIYAAATDKQYQKSGIMTSMLSFCDELLKSRNVDFVFLKPADEGLYNYYHKRGFDTAFYNCKLTISKHEIDNIDFMDFNYVNWNQNVKKLDEAYSDKCVCFNSEKGYARVYITDNRAMIKNIVTDNIKVLLKDIINKTEVELIDVEMPVDCINNYSGEQYKTGQIKIINKDIKLNDFKIYLGISLE